jgi:hypothetical protein
MPNRANITTDHEQIRRWTEQRGGHPAAVRRSRGKEGDPGILRIDFPGYTGAQSLEQISWEEFFERFDNQNLAFVYQETTARGLRSNFNKLIKRRPVEKSQTVAGRSAGLGGATRGKPAGAAKRAHKPARGN